MCCIFYVKFALCVAFLEITFFLLRITPRSDRRAVLHRPERSPSMEGEPSRSPYLAMFAYSEGIAAVRASPSAASLREAYREAKASYAQNPSEEHHQAWKTAKNSYKQRKKLDELDRAATKIQAHHRRITGFRYAQARLAQQRDDIWNEIRGDAVVQIQSAFRGWNYRRMHSNRVNEMAMASALADTDVPSDHDAIDRNSGKNSPDAVDGEGDEFNGCCSDLDTNEVQSVEEEADVTEEVRTGRGAQEEGDVIRCSWRIR